jgi:phosphoglycolate phosphatase
MAMNGLRNLLFDLDGTLVDSRVTIGASLSHALERMGLSSDIDGQIDSIIGTPLLDIFCNDYGLSQCEAETAIDHYRVHYDRQGQAGTHIYPDIQDVLPELNRAGFRLFVATVKPTRIAEKVLADLQMRSWFDGVAGSSMNHERRDKSSIIAHALKKFDLDPECSMMIGDRGQDISGARDNGLYSLAVSYGFGSMEELQASRPDHIVSCSREISVLLVGRH